MDLNGKERHSLLCSRAPSPVQCHSRNKQGHGSLRNWGLNTVVSVRKLFTLPEPQLIHLGKEMIIPHLRTEDGIQ